LSGHRQFSVPITNIFHGEWSGSMPIIVDEIVISVEVAGQARVAALAPVEDLKQDIIRQCVDRVLEILREREESRSR
jgi:uncharacterized protein DUF5908